MHGLVSRTVQWGTWWRTSHSRGIQGGSAQQQQLHPSICLFHTQHSTNTITTMKVLHAILIAMMVLCTSEKVHLSANSGALAMPKMLTGIVMPLRFDSRQAQNFEKHGAPHPHPPHITETTPHINRKQLIPPGSAAALLCRLTTVNACKILQLLQHITPYHHFSPHLCKTSHQHFSPHQRHPTDCPNTPHATRPCC